MCECYQWTNSSESYSKEFPICSSHMVQHNTFFIDCDQFSVENMHFLEFNVVKYTHMLIRLQWMYLLNLLWNSASYSGNLIFLLYNIIPKDMYCTKLYVVYACIDNPKINRKLFIPINICLNNVCNWQTNKIST